MWDVCLLTLADTLATQRYALDQQVWSTELDLCRRLLETWWEGPAEVIRPARCFPATICKNTSD